MAQIRPPSTISKFSHSTRFTEHRRALFPTSNNNDSDSDLGHISPLTDSNIDSSHSSPSSQCTESDTDEQYFAGLNANTFKDYVILENLNNYEADKKNINASVKIASGTPQNTTNVQLDCMSPLYLSPLQSLLTSPIIKSPKKVKLCSVIPDTPLKESPILNPKTPHDSTNVNSKVPKLVRKSFIETCQDDLDNGKRKAASPLSPPTCKNQKLESTSSKTSKVRTTLFPELSVPTRSFYPKLDNHRTERKYVDHETSKKRHRNNTSSLYLCSRQKKKNYFGQINAGVRHKIRKPKQKKITKSRILKVALSIIDNSPLNDYLEEITQLKNLKKKHYEQSKIDNNPKLLSSNHNIFKEIQPENDVYNIKTPEREITPPPDPTKKFFKSSRTKGIVNIDKVIKIKVDKGRMTLLESNIPPKKRKLEKVTFDSLDFMVADNEDFMLSDKINSILDVLENDKENVGNNFHSDIENDVCKNDVCKNDGQEVGNNVESPSKILLTAHTSVFASENSIHLHATSTEQITKTTVDEKLQTQHFSAPQTINQSHILLSPTSQMCNMTSGLAINSPKKAKQNVTAILENISDISYIHEINKVPSGIDVEEKKLFPIFYGSSTPQKSSKIVKKESVTKKWKQLPKDQMLLDAGQKHFGVTQCSECNIVYHMGDPDDELKHHNFHNAVNVLHFNGWKSERIVSNVIDGKIIKVIGSDSKVWWKKIKEVLEVVNRDLGFYEMDLKSDHPEMQVYLYIKNKSIVGCLVAEPKSTAFRMLSSDGGIDICSEESYPIKCGVSRIWVSQGNRKKGIGTSLMNCLRGNFIYGSILNYDDIALSSPTEMGKSFAAQYFNTCNYLVYTF